MSRLSKFLAVSAAGLGLAAAGALAPATAEAAPAPASVSISASSAAPAAAPAAAQAAYATPHGWCSFVAGSATVNVQTTRVAGYVVQVDVYASRAVNMQSTSWAEFPRYHFSSGYGTHIVKRMDGLTRPVDVYIRATRGGVGGSCYAPITSTIARVASQAGLLKAQDSGTVSAVLASYVPASSPSSTGSCSRPLSDGRAIIQRTSGRVGDHLWLHTVALDTTGNAYNLVKDRIMVKGSKGNLVGRHRGVAGAVDGRRVTWHVYSKFANGKAHVSGVDQITGRYFSAVC